MYSATRRFRLLVLILLFTVAAVAKAQQSQKAIQPTDLFKIKQIGSVHIEPNGHDILYTVTSIVPMPDTDAAHTYRTQLYLTPMDGHEEPLQLTHDPAGASQPAWGPDGEKIAFVRPVDGKPQVFILPLFGGEPVQLTHFKYGAFSPQFSPDGKHILFSASVDHSAIASDSLLNGGQPKLPWPMERPGRNDDIYAEKLDSADADGSLSQVREWLAQNGRKKNPKVIYRLNFKAEKSLQPERSFRHLFVIEANPEMGIKPLDLTPGYHSFGGAVWSPDSRQIVFSGSRDNNKNPDRVRDSDLFRVNRDGSGFEKLLDLEHYSVYSPSVSHDGRKVLFAGSDQRDRGYAQSMIGVLDLESGSTQWITKELDRGVYSAKWSGNDRYAYFTTASNGGFPLYRVSLKNAKIEQLLDFDKGVRSFDVHKAGLAYVLTEVKDPYELYSAKTNATSPKRLTDFNASWLADKKLSFPEKHELTRPDGTKVDYWIMKPTFYQEGQSYPLMLELHGGPSAMWGPGEVTMWHEFQLYAAKGYGIVYSNPRGSGGYGRDFQHGNHQNWGEGPTGDVLAAADKAAALPWTDPKRQVVTGGSYAGYLTAWIVGHDHRFKAAVAQRGVYDLETFLGEGNAWRLIPDRFGGYPWQDDIRKLLDRESPLTYADQIQTPLMIIHGDTDYRTGQVQSEVLYRELKIMDKPVEYIRYPGAGHELSRSGDPEQRVDRLLRIYEFMERYIQH